MSDARQRAEEALAIHETTPCYPPLARECTCCAMDRALRALLAETAQDDEVHRERDLLRERLNQFDAYGFPNVATVLDRLEALRASRSIDLDETAPAPPQAREVEEDDVSCYHCGATHWCSECEEYAALARGGA